MRKLFYVTLCLVFVISAQEMQAQRKKKQDTAPATETPKPKPKNGMKAYDEVITKDAVTDEGLFTVHKVDDKYYFEIPDSLLGREILNVSRIAGIIEGFSFGGAGMKSGGQKVFRFEKKDKNLLLRYVSYSSVASEDDPIYQSVRNNNFEPIIENFKIETMRADSTAYVIDVTNFFTDDVNIISPLGQSQRTNFGVRSIDKSRTLIDEIKSFPMNTEVKHILTFSATKLPSNSSTGTLSLKMNQSFVLLPKKAMMPRVYDRRVSYFSVSQQDYSRDEQKAASRRYVTRWKLVPKDVAAYNRGELVDPVKPIVYYVDPATPLKWRKYIKQGIEDWQEAFEVAGFSNAIIAMDPPSPEEDPDWSPEDVRYSVVRYISTTIQNAQGPHVHDPRSGEIIESDILWYHNVMNLLRNWYFIQTSAINPEARSVKFRDEVMGELIRFVSAHEVGHTLGLPHNMGASWSYPVDSLRSASFTQRMGTAPSIMDYARFNYIAQPGDEGVRLMPGIGVYDKHAINWAYRFIPGANNPDDEKTTLDAWILEHADDPMYRYGFQNGVDPSSQTEDLGDNSVKASEYGLANLKRIVPNLIEWTGAEGRDYEDLEELYGQVMGQFSRYIGHVSTNVGGVYNFNKNYEQGGDVYVHVGADLQRSAVKWLNDNLFTTPAWLLDKEILNRTGIEPVDRIGSIQSSGLNRLLRQDRLLRMVENEQMNGSAAYKATAMLSDLRASIWLELSRGRTIDPFRRNLQRAHVDALGRLLEADSDVSAMSRAELSEIRRSANSAIARTSDAMSKYHLQDMVAKIDQTLDPR